MYEVNKAKRTVKIFYIRHRKDVYRK
ncbi:hypothetical protein IIC38_02165 [candidate division KSB1 bacterium]|nr:hypothetical protein [candidate division KSB1 bacterium]